MKTRLFLGFIIAITVFTQFGCVEEYMFPSYPERTFEGANTFACRINRGPWIADSETGYNFKQGSFTPRFLEMSFNLEDSTFYLAGFRDIPSFSISEALFLYAPALDTGIYPFLPTTYFENWASDEYYALDTTKPNQMHIEFIDWDSSFVAGTFELNLVDPEDSLNFLQILDGRFDQNDLEH